MEVLHWSCRALSYRRRLSSLELEVRAVMSRFSCRLVPPHCSSFSSRRALRVFLASCGEFCFYAEATPHFSRNFCATLPLRTTSTPNPYVGSQAWMQVWVSLFSSFV